MAQQAMDTFVAVMDDGSDRLVQKGEVFPDKHELVKRAGTVLFRPLDLGDGDPKASSRKPAATAAAAAAAADAVKADG